MGKFGIDWRMFPMKVHYFLRFMGTGPLTVFLPVITRKKGVPAQVVGEIWTVLPFMSLVTKISAGTIADYTRGHRAVFLTGLTLMMTSLTALYWVPDIPPPCPPTPGNLTQGTLPTPVPSMATSSGVADQLPTEPLSSTLPPPCLHTQEGKTGLAEEVSHWDLMGRYEFWLLFLCLLGQYCGHTTGITMQETVCFQMLGEARHRYGAQRVWGTVGLGLSAILAGALVDWYSKGLGRQDYLPAHVLTVVFLAADLVVVARLRFPLPERSRGPAVTHGAQWWLGVTMVLVSTGVAGAACGMLWTFEFILVEDVAKEWHPSFPHLKLLLGLLMGVQCFLAEVPFFVMAGSIIKRLGHVSAFFVSLLGFSVRLCIYAAVSNPWWFLPADLLHGISFGVFYPCFTSYASTVSPKGAEATTQAIFGATFFSCTGVGGLVGGQLYHGVGGRRAFLILGLAIGVYALAFVSVNSLLARCRPAAESGSRAECVGLKVGEGRAISEPVTGEGHKRRARESEMAEDGVS